MKISTQYLLAAMAALSLAGSSVALGQTTVTTATTSDGTISEFSPDTIVVHSTAAPEPVHYTYSKTTTYVDDTGAPVSMELVRSGLPVTVQYIKEGDRLIANRVIVHKSVTTTAPAVSEEKTTTTTTTTTTK